MSEINSECSFLSSYAHVLVCLSENPRARLREVAERVGVTERTASRIIRRLDDEGFLERQRRGRRNVYRVRIRQPLRHPIESGCTLEDLLRPVVGHGGGNAVRSHWASDADAVAAANRKQSTVGADSAEREGRSDRVEVKECTGQS